MGRTKKYSNGSDLLKIIMDSDLSPVSKRVYVERLKTMVGSFDTNVYWIITHPTEVLEWILKKSEVLSTQKSYIIAVLAIFKHNEGLKTQLNKYYKEWFTKFSEIDEAITQRYKTNEPTERQLNAYVPFNEIIKKRDTLEEGNIDKLLLSFYTHIRPLRADFNAVRIYKFDDKIPDKKEPNYIIFENPNKVFLYLHEFKTQRSHNEFKKELPTTLVKELKASLNKCPREWLFVDKFGKPYIATNSYTRWANRTFQKLFGKPLTITLIRHSFISSLDQNTLTTLEKEEIAKEMAHSRGMQELYRFVKKSSSGGGDGVDDTIGEGTTPGNDL
jgi:integrase